MKYLIVLYDGMADYPVPCFNGKTPMMMAQKPVFDSLAQRATVGLVRTVAPGLKPGSDVANLSVLGYDPKLYYTGRSPLEAVSMGVKMADTDIALRCNLVTLSDEENYADKTMVDYCAGDISTAEAAELIKAVQEGLGNDVFAFYPGVSYRHCLSWKNGTTDLGNMTPPHDISGRVVGEYLSKSENAAPLLDLMKKSVEILKNHPVNQARVAAGKRPATSIWLWGEGKKPILKPFQELYGVKGSIISAVDLLKGIAISAGMNAPDVEGATGYIDTNYAGKVAAAISEWDNGQDLVYLHFEGPDECGHRNEPENKVKCIELIDEKVLTPLIEKLNSTGEDYKIMILPDPPTPIVTGTHASDPVPFLIYEKDREIESGVTSIDEETAKTTGVFVEKGHELMKIFLGRQTIHE